MKKHQVTVIKPDGSTEVQTRPSWYRRPSLAFSRPADDVFFKTQRTAYLDWLCRDKSWFTAEKTCPECHGAKTVMPSQAHMTPNRFSTWRRKRRAAGLPVWLTDADRIDCPTCDGTGTVPNDGACLDLERAKAYIAEQRARLEMLAQAAVEAIAPKMIAQGWRQMFSGLPLVATIAEYDAQVAAYEQADREMKEAREAAEAGRKAFEREYNAWTEEKKLEFINGPHRFPYRELEETANRLHHKFFAYGHRETGFWYKPGSRRIMWVGSRNAPNYYDAPKPADQLVIKPGRSPSGYELDMLVEALTADPEIQLALVA